MKMYSIFVLISLVSSQYNPYFDDYTPFTYPDSLTQAYLCHPDKTSESIPSFICDPNRVLKGNSTELDEELKLFEKSTNCSCPIRDMCRPFFKGTTISVTIVEKMRLNENKTNSRAEILEAARLFADTVRDRQQRGQCDDDILIFLSVKDDVVWTSIGSAVPLSSNDIQYVSEQGDVFFKKHQYDQGLIWMTKQYLRIVRGEEAEKLWKWPIPEWQILIFISFSIIFVAAIICLIIYCSIKYCRKNHRDEYSVVDH